MRVQSNKYEIRIRYEIKLTGRPSLTMSSDRVPHAVMFDLKQQSNTDILVYYMFIYWVRSLAFETGTTGYTWLGSHTNHILVRFQVGFKVVEGKVFVQK